VLCAACLHGPPPLFGLLARHIPAPKFRAAFACPLFPQTHQACRMQGWGQTRLAALRESEREETFLHGHTTDSAAPLPLQPEHGPEGRCCRSTLQSTSVALRTCTVSCLHGCLVQLSSTTRVAMNGGMETNAYIQMKVSPDQ